MDSGILRKSIRVFLSFFVVVQLWIIFVIPLGDSLLNRGPARWVSSWAGTLGMHTRWKFFAPNPGVKRWLELELYFKGQGEPVVQTWPEKSADWWNFQNHRRQMYHAVMIASREEILEGYFKPFACRHFKDLERFYVTLRFTEVPSIEKSQTLRDSDREGLESQQRISVKEYLCADPL